MTKLLAAAAVAAIAISGAAFAEDGKVTTPKAMSDSEMDKVTAGFNVLTNRNGVITQSNVNDNALSNGHGLRGTGNNAACVPGTGGTC